MVGAAVLLVAGTVIAVGRLLRRRMLDPLGVKAAAQALRTAGLAGPPLREGLTIDSAAQALPYLLALLETPGVALCGPDGSVLGALGPGSHHAEQVLETVVVALRSDRRQLATCSPCGQPGCQVGRAVIAPLGAAGESAGALVVLAESPVGPYLVRATDETARFITTQLELADLAVSRADLARAEVRALRAQISPHFIYNALTTIAAFVRSDPDRARELLLEFADFTRYSFRQAGEFTTLADEMGTIEKYLTLERAGSVSVCRFAGWWPLRSLATRLPNKPRSAGSWSGLVRAQLAASLRIASVALAIFAPLPALFALVPALQDLRILGVPVIWWVLGLLAYPALYLLARLHRRQAERIEGDFTELLGQGPS